MNLISAILKIIKMYSLTADSQEYQDLYNDAKKWELEKASAESTDTIGKMYHNLHKSIWFRLAMPFLFFVAMGEIKKLMNPDVEEGDF
ncbi:hypothetical protein ACFSKN_02065 [Mariniflexile gromovii]|uniref:Uncharacterized protein n=1 Tax=Mariniflexile gromovii TaxID=362523 RepID=A0ABS4BP60_9FLAO|nr:hypothetical protein [Mariniflexile gromovii]MBP0902387.1 hypothetical protein [Mariniflexile gromovii]